MRLKFLGLAASSLLLLACGEESTSSSVTPLSDAQVLAQLASGVTAVGVVGNLSGMATSKFSQSESEPLLSARAADECTDAFNTTTTFTDDTTGEKVTMTLKTTFANGSAITCDNFSEASGFKFQISMVSPGFSMAMVMTTTPTVDGGMSIVGSGSGTFSEEGHSGAFSDLSFTQTIDSLGEIVAYAGSMKMAFDGATTDAIAFDEQGPTAQIVKVYRNGGVIGTLTFAADGSVVVKDAAGKIVGAETVA